MTVKLITLSAIFGLSHISSLLGPAIAHSLQTRTSKADIFDYNCVHLIFKADYVRLRVKDACHAFKNSPELSRYPAYLKDDHIFGEENHGRLISWPLHLRNSRYQERKVGPFRIILTTSCDLVAVAVVHKPENANENAKIVPCTQFITIGSRREPIRNEDAAVDELARFKCGEEIIFTQKFASNLVNRGCKLEIVKHVFITAAHQKNMFSATELWMYPEKSTKQNLGAGGSKYYGAVFDKECNLHGMIYSEGEDVKRCAEAKIVRLNSDNAENRLNDSSDDTILLQKNTMSCAGQSLSLRMIIDNLNIAKYLLEAKLRNPATKSNYPMMTQEGRVWLWPIRSQENITEKNRKKHLFFMMGIDSSGKMVDVYYTTSRRPDVRKYTRCKKNTQKDEQIDSNVTLELPVVIHNLDSEEE